MALLPERPGSKWHHQQKILVGFFFIFLQWAEVETHHLSLFMSAVYVINHTHCMLAVGRLAELKPTYKYRSQFFYSNFASVTLVACVHFRLNVVLINYLGLQKACTRLRTQFWRLHWPITAAQTLTPLGVNNSYTVDVFYFKHYKLPIM